MNKKNHIALLSVTAVLALSGMTACSKSGGGSGGDSTKANITVATYDGGVGSSWLTEAAKAFEEKYKDATGFQEGRTGVKVNVVANRGYSGDNLLEGSLNKDIYFTENVDYINMVNNDKMADITDVLTGSLSDYNETGTILDKIDSGFASYLNRSGKYYAVPFYDAFYGFVYDVDLFDEKGLYINAAGTGITKGRAEKGNGPDGVQGTADDGLPATYAQFKIMLKGMVDMDITPISYSSTYNEYVLRTLTNYWSNYEGLEQMNLNYTFSGTATDIATVSGGSVSLQNETITEDNGYELQKQAGKYYALDFLKNGLLGDSKNMYGASTHIAAQSNFVESKYYGTAYAMLCDGSWWENEASESFTSLDRMGYEHGNYAIMPVPHVDESHVGQKQTVLSQNSSYGFIASNCSNMALAKEFMKFLHTDAQLSAFTAETSMTRALNYEISETDQASVTTYGKSLINLKKNANVIYPVSSLSKFINNPNLFKTDAWAWKSNINGSDYTNPLTYMQQSNSSVEAYFNGLYTSAHTAWSSLR